METFWERGFKRTQNDEGQDKEITESEETEQYNKDNDESSGQYTLLHYASSGGDIDIFKFVVSQCKNLGDTLFD